MLSNTTAAKVWLVCRPADYTAHFHYDYVRPALSPGVTGTLFTRPCIPSLHHLFLGWHKHFCSCMVNWILPAKRQQARPSLPKQLLLVATLVQEFPVWSKNHSSHPFATTAWPDCRSQAPNLLIGLAKCVTTTCCASICNLLWLHVNLFFQQAR